MTKRDEKFVETVWDYYRTHGRHDLPWRVNANPYHIVVSEIMLQQTQVDRVIPKYHQFLTLFPTINDLANAPLADVLTAWQGLGYNRRAKLLHDCARVITTEYHGVWPTDETSLRQLPGIGPYTAGAIMAFAFQQGMPIIETNIRTVYFHHYYQTATTVTDAELLPHITRSLDRQNPREWYYALMDYGSHLKRTVGNNIQKSKTYKRQSAFVGSVRQVRGAIIDCLRQSGTVTTRQLLTRLGHLSQVTPGMVETTLATLQKDGLIEQSKQHWHLPGINQKPRQVHPDDQRRTTENKKRLKR